MKNVYKVFLNTLRWMKGIDPNPDTLRDLEQLYMEHKTHSNQRQIGVFSQPFWQRKNHVRKSRNRHRYITYVKQNPKVLPFTLLEWIQLIRIFEALPTQWRTSLASCGPRSRKTFILRIKLNSALKPRPCRSRKSSPRIFTLKLEQDMKPN